MDSRQIRAICHADPELNCLFMGVYPCDKLPENQTGFIICNQDKHTEPGSHWVCIFILPNKHAEFFNSYGGDPYPKSIADYLEGYSIVSSQKQVQSNMSTTCGQHCIYFAFHRVRDIPFEQIVESYSNDLLANDQTVVEFVNETCGMHTELLDEDLLYIQLCRALGVSKSV